MISDRINKMNKIKKERLGLKHPAVNLASVLLWYLNVRTLSFSFLSCESC
jgi:hypothetical protein